MSGMGRLEGIVIVEVLSSYLGLPICPVDVMGQRRQLQVIAGIRLQTQKPLQGVVGVTWIFGYPRAGNDQPDFLFRTFDASQYSPP